MPLADRGKQLLDLLSIEGLGPPHVAGRGGATPGEKPSTPAAATASKPMSGAPRRWACFPGEIPRKVLRTYAATSLNGPAASTARIATRPAMAARIPTMAKGRRVVRGGSWFDSRRAPRAGHRRPDRYRLARRTGSGTTPRRSRPCRGNPRGRFLADRCLPPRSARGSAVPPLPMSR